MMLKIEDLSVNYGHITALSGISLEVAKNEIVSLIGSNGAGKTTSLMAISGLVSKTSGRIEFNGQDITKTNAHSIVHMGISHVPEGRHVFPKLSVENNLLMGTIAAGRLPKGEIVKRMEEVFELFPRLRERRRQTGGTLSGGEQQMLAIGRGLMSEPSLVMLDEPSLGLAPIIVEEIFELISQIKASGKTVLLIEQNASMALSISDRGYVLENGRIVTTGTGVDLLGDEEVRRAYLGA